MIEGNSYSTLKVLTTWSFQQPRSTLLDPGRASAESVRSKPGFATFQDRGNCLWANWILGSRNRFHYLAGSMWTDRPCLVWGRKSEQIYGKKSTARISEFCPKYQWLSRFSRCIQRIDKRWTTIGIHAWNQEWVKSFSRMRQEEKAGYNRHSTAAGLNIYYQERRQPLSCLILDSRVVIPKFQSY